MTPLDRIVAQAAYVVGALVFALVLAALGMINRVLGWLS